jgi:hypothetical protein
MRSGNVFPILMKSRRFWKNISKTKKIIITNYNFFIKECTLVVVFIFLVYIIG